jgi:predicted nuclease of predicted toxin-antitoxin system
VRWLVDEMLPPSTATELVALGHDAVGARAAGLGEAPDEQVYDLAVREGRVVVTENFADYARLVEARVAAEQPCVPVVFVRKRNHPRGGGLGKHLAARLDAWAADNPDPYPGLHWP